MRKHTLNPKKYILRRAKNGVKRTKHVSAAVYGTDKIRLQREADEFARTLGHKSMSISAYINLKLVLP